MSRSTSRTGGASGSAPLTQAWKMKVSLGHGEQARRITEAPRPDGSPPEQQPGPPAPPRPSRPRTPFPCPPPDCSRPVSPGKALRKWRTHARRRLLPWTPGGRPSADADRHRPQFSHLSPIGSHTSRPQPGALGRPNPRRNHRRATLHQPVVQGETIPETTTVPLQEREPELLRRDPPFRCPDARIPVNLRCSQHNIAQIQARFPEGPAYAYLQDQARSCALQQTGQSVGGVGLVIAGLNDDPCPAPRSFGEPAEPPGFPGNRLLPGSFHHAEKGLDLRPGSSKEGNLRLRPLKQAPGIRKRGPQSRSRSIMHPPSEGYPGPPGS